MLDKNQVTQEVFVHYNDIIKYIGQHLNLNMKKTSVYTIQKSVIANESNNYQHKAFDKLIVEDKNTQSQYEFKDTELKELIAKNLQVTAEVLDLFYFCNLKPGSNNTELNYINVTSNNPEVKLNLDTTFNKIEQLRKKFLAGSNSNTQNMSL